MQNGGFRPGSGRKKGQKNKKTILENEARAILVDSILKDWEPMIETLKDIAMGKIKYSKVVGKDKVTGEDIEKIYTKPPSESALQELISMVVGKPKQEVSGTINMPQLQDLTQKIADILQGKKPQQIP